MSHDDTANQFFNHGIPAGYTEGTSRASSIQVHGGGVVRVQHGVPAEEAPQAPRDSFRVYTGAVRYCSMLDAIEEGHARHIYSDAGTQGGSVMSTLRTTGTHPTVELVPGQPSSRTLLATAEREGLIERREGRYVDARPTGHGDVAITDERPTQVHLDAAIEADRVAKADEREQQEKADTQDVFNAIEDEAWRHDMGSIPEPAFRAAAASSMRAVVLGTDLAAAAKVLTQNTGMEPAAALSKIEDAVWVQTQIVERAISKVGIDQGNVDDFYNECRANPGEMQNAISSLLHGRDVRPFQQMARQFVAKRARGG